MYKISLCMLAICLQASDIRISEVMSNPQGSEYENEYIEIYNSSNHVIYINGWILSDGNGVDTLIHFSGPTGLQVHEYALILDPGYDFISGPYLPLIPDSIPIYTISTGSSFGSSGLSNSGESVIIYNPDSSIISQMTWSSASDNGYSWERVSVKHPDSTAVWQQSLTENGTPGFLNSVTKPQHNLSLIDAVVTHTAPGEAVEILLTIRNSGENIVSDFSITSYQDDNQNGIQDTGEWNQSQKYMTPLIPEGDLELSVMLFKLEPGIHHVETWISSEGDGVSSDDTLCFQIKGPYPFDVVSITEIMSSPTSEQGGEWIEIKNLSTKPISLQGWALSDANRTRHLISDSLLFLQPDSFFTFCAKPEVLEYFTLSSDQALALDSWPTLNSASDSVRLFDATDHLIARIFYRGSWGTSGLSLERRHPELFPQAEWNWAPSTHINGGTPSFINTQQLPARSIQIDGIKIHSSNQVGPRPVLITVYFSNQGLSPVQTLQFESGNTAQWQGYLPSFQVDSLSLETPILASGISNIYIRVFADQILLADTTIQAMLGFPPDLIAINEIHFLPGEDQVEFLEFVNIGADTLNLTGWTFGDRSGARGIISSQMLVPPDSLFLLCGDSISLGDWTAPDTRIFELSSWPSLNNSSDSILIKDLIGNRQLAHGYSAIQGGEIGRSLERLALWKPAEANASWTTSHNIGGITPGRNNSVQVPPINISMVKFQVVDSLLRVNETFQVSVQLVNAGNYPISSANLNIQVGKTDNQLHLIDQTMPNLLPGDTLVWQTDLELGQCGWITITAEITSPEDWFTRDDRITLNTYVSCTKSPFVINEIMPIPRSSQPEWVEIYNRSNRDIDLQGWLISDNNLSGEVILDSSLTITSNSYFLLSSQPRSILFPENCQIIQVSGMPTFNNTEDAAILYDPQGLWMDGMSYDNYTALVEGRSLERIQTDASGSDPRNWGICIDDLASTPGFENSLNLVELPPKLKIDLSPNPFTPNGDGQQDQVIMTYELPIEQGQISIIIFDMAGRKIAEPALARPVSHRGQLSWDGRANYGGIAVTGLYICKVMVDNQHGQVIETLKKIYLVN